jgi:hypothetical protein
MRLQALSDLVDFLAIRVERNANEVESIRGNRRDRGAIIGVVVGLEQRPGVDRRLRAAVGWRAKAFL